MRVIAAQLSGWRPNKTRHHNVDFQTPSMRMSARKNRRAVWLRHPGKGHLQKEINRRCSRFARGDLPRIKRGHINISRGKGEGRYAVFLFEAQCRNRALYDAGLAQQKFRRGLSDLQNPGLPDGLHHLTVKQIGTGLMQGCRALVRGPTDQHGDGRATKGTGANITRSCSIRCNRAKITKPLSCAAFC